MTMDRADRLSKELSEELIVSAPMFWQSASVTVPFAVSVRTSSDVPAWPLENWESSLRSALPA